MSDRMSDRMPEHMWCDNLMWCFYHGSALLVCFKSIACFFFKTIAYCFFCEMVDLYEDWQTICQNRCLEMPWWRSLEVKWADMQNVQITKVPCFFFGLLGSKMQPPAEAAPVEQTVNSYYPLLNYHASAPSVRADFFVNHYFLSIFINSY